MRSPTRDSGTETDSEAELADKAEAYYPDGRAVATDDSCQNSLQIEDTVNAERAEKFQQFFNATRICNILKLYVEIQDLPGDGEFIGLLVESFLEQQQVILPEVVVDFTPQNHHWNWAVDNRGTTIIETLHSSIEGRFISWISQSGYGFIKNDFLDENIFCHISQIEHELEPDVDAEVVFDLVCVLHNGEVKQQAANCKIVAAAEIFEDWEAGNMFDKEEEEYNEEVDIKADPVHEEFCSSNAISDQHDNIQEAERSQTEEQEELEFIDPWNDQEEEIINPPWNDQEEMINPPWEEETNQTFFEVGTSVEVVYDDGIWYPGIIVGERNENDFYVVSFESYPEPDEVSAKFVRARQISDVFEDASAEVEQFYI